MSYRRTRGFGQVPQAVAFTCPNGTIIGVPPGGDANALCEVQRLKPEAPTDVRTMPQPTTSDAVAQALITGSVNIASAVDRVRAGQQPMQPQPQGIPQYFAPPPPAPSNNWALPAIAVGLVGLFWWSHSGTPVKQNTTKPARRPTIYEALRVKLGREPTNAELRADVERIKEEGLVERATAGKLSFQRRRRRS